MSIIKRKGPKGVRWGVKIKAQGKQWWVGTYDSYAEAKQVEHEEMARAFVPAARNLTCDEFAKQWLATPTSNRPSTTSYNRSALKGFSTDFKGKKLRDIDPIAAKKWANEPKNKWRVSTVRAMFNEAVRLRCCPSNPFANLRLAKSKGRSNIVPLTAEEVQQLAACGTKVWGEGVGQELKSLILFAAYSGLRRGECSPLEWSDIDFERKTITVSKTVSNDTEIQLPKNDEIRVIKLFPIAEQALREMPRHLGRELVFATPSGSRYTKSSWHHYWNPLRVKFGKLDYDFHELRHYCATWLLYTVGLNPRLTAKHLGHTDTKLVEKLYGHPNDDADLAATDDAIRRWQAKSDVVSMSDYREQRQAEDTTEHDQGDDTAHGRRQ